MFAVVVPLHAGCGILIFEKEMEPAGLPPISDGISDGEVPDPVRFLVISICNHQDCLYILLPY